jgi:hypothetical protein
VLHPPYIVLIVAAICVALVASIQAAEPTAPQQVANSDDSAQQSLGALNAGFSCGARSSAAPTRQESAAEPEVPSAPARSGFALKKWECNSADAPRALVVPASAGSLRQNTGQQAGLQTPSNSSAWQGAFRAVPVTDSGVVQTAAAAPVETAKTAMLPLPPPGILRGQQGSNQPQSPNIEVPITPPAASSTITPDESADVNPKFAEKCKSPRDLKAIGSITADIGVKHDDVTGAKGLPPECPLGDERIQPRHWRKTLFAWTAADTYHKPIYFDDEQLERYGHTFGPVAQTTLSAVKFFATAPLVPYYMGVTPPNECIYDLGTYRPGSCAPYYIDPFPLSVRGAINEMYLGILPAL